jgi:hypothetical protein
MVDVNPKLTPTKLKKSARKTSEGKGLAPLPGVQTDAKLAATANPKDPKSPYYKSKHHDPKGFGKNRELAKRINKAVQDLKKSDENGPRFLVAWRMYPNDEHPAWHSKDAHFCGCGCGCFAGAAPKGNRKPKGRK